MAIKRKIGHIMKYSKLLLIVACFLSFAVAIFQAVISFSPSWSEYFGAPEELISNQLLLIVAGIVASLVFFVFGVFALSAVGRIRPLPFLKMGLLGIGGIYTIRGLVFLPILLKTAQNPQLPNTVPPDGLESSLVSLFIGIIYLSGTISGWKDIPFKN
jgi:hypothetical protein